jgi:hypothetical protein
MGWMIWFSACQAKNTFLFSKIPSLVVGPTQLPVHTWWGYLTSRVGFVGCEVHHQPSCRTGFNKEWNSTCVSLIHACVSEQGNFTFVSSKTGLLPAEDILPFVMLEHFVYERELWDNIVT